MSDDLIVNMSKRQKQCHVWGVNTETAYLGATPTTPPVLLGKENVYRCGWRLGKSKRKKLKVKKSWFIQKIIFWKAIVYKMIMKFPRKYGLY